MAQTFGDVVRSVRGHCSLAPALLCRTWVQNGYNKIADRRHWAHLRSEGAITIQASRDGTCTFTQGSDLVAPGTLTFSSSDVGRQLQRIGGGIPFTIIALSGPSAQIDQTWLLATDSTPAEARVLDAYATLPDDFGSFIAVTDPAADWLLNIWVTEDELNFRDPGRKDFGQPYWLVSRRLSTGIAATLGRVQYEVWPYPTSARRLPYYYTKRPQEFADTDYFTGPFRQRGDVLLLAALVEACEWPGTEDRKNPYFNLGLAQRKRDELEKELGQLETRDEEIYMTWLETISWIRSRSVVPMDANWRREHEY